MAAIIEGGPDRADIVQIGTIDENGQPTGWGFDCKGKAVGIDLGADGNLLLAGWSVRDLRRIAEEWSGRE